MLYCLLLVLVLYEQINSVLCVITTLCTQILGTELEIVDAVQTLSMEALQQESPQ